jgi:hypothetical protein
MGMTFPVLKSATLVYISLFGMEFPAVVLHVSFCITVVTGSTRTALWIGEKSCSGTGITKLGSLARSSSTVFVTELANKLVDIDVIIGCLAEGLGSSHNKAFVAFVETIEKH